MTEIKKRLGILIVMVGLSGVASPVDKSSIDVKTKGAALALIETAMNNAWPFTDSHTEQELKTSLGNVFTGPLLDEIYKRSAPYLNVETSWDSKEIRDTKLVLEKNGITAFVDFVEIGLSDQQSRPGKAVFHLTKVKAGWRIDKQGYKNQ